MGERRRRDRPDSDGEKNEKERRRRDRPDSDGEKNEKERGCNGSSSAQLREFAKKVRKGHDGKKETRQRAATDEDNSLSKQTGTPADYPEGNAVAGEKLRRSMGAVLQITRAKRNHHGKKRQNQSPSASDDQGGEASVGGVIRIPVNEESRTKLFEQPRAMTLSHRSRTAQGNILGVGPGDGSQSVPVGLLKQEPAVEHGRSKLRHSVTDQTDQIQAARSPRSPSPSPRSPSPSPRSPDRSRTKPAPKTDRPRIGTS